MRAKLVQPAILSDAASVELDGLLHDAVERRKLPNVVAVVANRESILYHGAVGASITDIFRLASMTKPITSVAVMMLRERGLLDLDDPLDRYLPEFGGRAVIDTFCAADNSVSTRAASGPPTLRHLLSHTAGFGYDFCNDIVLALCKDGAQSPRTLPLLNDPGSRWTYGCATAILGDVIARVTGEPFYIFLEKQILHPLGMVETSYFLNEKDLHRLVPIHLRVDQTYIKDPSTRHEPYLSADAGLLGTADEYIRFLQMLLNGGQLGNTRLLTEQSVAEMTSNQIGALTVERQVGSKPQTASPFPIGANKDKFGLGFQLKTEGSDNARSAGSYSWGGIFNTHFWGDPQKGVAVVFLTQLLPYYDEQTMQLLSGFEACVYKHLV